MDYIFYLIVMIIICAIAIWAGGKNGL
jgi:hypothetical protein